LTVKDQMRALGRQDLPAEVRLEEGVFRLTVTVKHNFVSAVGLYRRGPDQVVLKCYRTAALLGVPLRWCGSLMAEHEARVLRRVQDLPGVPTLIRRHGATGIVRQFIPGAPLTRRSCVGDGFFPALERLLADLHQRGVAYVDLEKAANVLVGGDGLPYLIDFQMAFQAPRGRLGDTSAVRMLTGWLQRADLYHLRKHWRRVRPDQLSEAEIRSSRRKPWPVRWGNALMAPWKAFYRRIRGRG